MKPGENIRAGRPSESELIFVAKPRRGIELNRGIELWRKLGNPVLEVKHSEIVAVDQVDKIHYPDEPPANDDSLVWACDFCGRYSRYRERIEAHEERCALNPRNQHRQPH